MPFETEARTSSGSRRRGATRTRQRSSDSETNSFGPLLDPIVDAHQDIANAGIKISGGARDAAEAVGEGVGDVLGGLGGLFGGPSGGGGPPPQMLPVDPAGRNQAAELAFADPTAARTAQAAQVDPNAFRAASALGMQNRSGQQLAAGGLGQLQDGFEAGQMRDALDLSRAAAMGEAPSAAAVQQQQGMDAALRSQLALAASARGGPGARVAAQRQAAQNAGLLQQQAVGDAARLRADEMAAARNQFAQQAQGMRALTGSELAQAGGLLTQARGQDIAVAGQELGLAGQQAGFDQGANLANLQAGQFADDLNLRREEAALQGFLDAEQTRQQAFQAPQTLQAQIEAARLSGDAANRRAMIGGLFGMGSAALPILFPGGGQGGG